MKIRRRLNQVNKEIVSFVEDVDDKMNVVLKDVDKLKISEGLRFFDDLSDNLLRSLRVKP